VQGVGSRKSQKGSQVDQQSKGHLIGIHVCLSGHLCLKGMRDADPVIGQRHRWMCTTSHVALSALNRFVVTLEERLIFFFCFRNSLLLECIGTGDHLPNSLTQKQSLCSVSAYCSLYKSQNDVSWMWEESLLLIVLVRFRVGAVSEHVFSNGRTRMGVVRRTGAAVGTA
jgi:hypothetical protein